MGNPIIYPLFLVLLLALIAFGAVRATRPTRTPSSWIAVAIGSWLAALVFMTVRPGSGLGVRLNLIPFVVDGPGSANDAVRNVFVFVPLGMLLAAAGWRLLTVLGAALAVSLSIEIAQYLTDWGRTADVNDLLTNVAGAAIGWVVAWAIRRTVTRRVATVSVEAPPAVY
jgi:glycopeptide antibiotics resistance protein